MKTANGANMRMLIGRALCVAGILISLATFVLHALPANWGIFLSASCFIVGSLFWPGWDAGVGGGDSEQPGK